MPSSRFDIDDIAVSAHGSVILARGNRRIAINNLSPDQVRLLVEASCEGTIPQTSASQPILAKLDKVGFPLAAKRSRFRFRVPSKAVAGAARPLLPFAHPGWIALFLFAGLATLVMVASSQSLPATPMEYLFGSHQAMAVMVLGFWLPVVFHELGHAAACLRFAGLVGGIRLKWHWGLPAVATDVTAVAIAGPKDRKWVNLAGPAWHMLVASGLYWASRDALPAMAVGATMSLALGLMALVPLPGFDGFWILQDATDCKITGPLRLPRRGDVLAPVYCWVLLLSFVTMFTASTIYWAGYFSAEAAGGGARHAVLQAFALVGLASALVALFVLTRFLRESRSP